MTLTFYSHQTVSCKGDEGTLDEEAQLIQVSDSDSKTSTGTHRCVWGGTGQEEHDWYVYIQYIIYRQSGAE